MATAIRGLDGAQATVRVGAVTNAARQALAGIESQVDPGSGQKGGGLFRVPFQLKSV